MTKEVWYNGLLTSIDLANARAGEAQIRSSEDIKKSFFENSFVWPTLDLTKEALRCFLSYNFGIYNSFRCRVDKQTFDHFLPNFKILKDFLDCFAVIHREGTPNYFVGLILENGKTAEFNLVIATQRGNIIINPRLSWVIEGRKNQAPDPSIYGFVNFSDYSTCFYEMRKNLIDVAGRILTIDYNNVAEAITVIEKSEIKKVWLFVNV